MNDFLNALGPFAYGLVLGYFWHPLWTVGKKIYSEAKKTREEWRQPMPTRQSTQTKYRDEHQDL